MSRLCEVEARETTANTCLVSASKPRLEGAVPRWPGYWCRGRARRRTALAREPGRARCRRTGMPAGPAPRHLARAGWRGCRRPYRGNRHARRRAVVVVVVCVAPLRFPVDGLRRYPKPATKARDPTRRRDGRALRILRSLDQGAWPRASAWSVGGPEDEPVGLARTEHPRRRSRQGNHGREIAPEAAA